MNKFQEVRKRITFENVGGSAATFWIKCNHMDGEIKCLSTNIKARNYIEAVDKGLKIADSIYSNHVKAIWNEVCEKSCKPTTLPTVIKSLHELAKAMNNGDEFDYCDLLRRNFIQDIADFTGKYICRRKGAMIMKGEKGKFIVAKYDEQKIANYLKSLTSSQK